MDGTSGLACYKSEAGERPLWDFPDGLWRREVAAYELDVQLGTDLVPTTVGRDDAPFGPGSLQWWVEDNGEEHYFTLRERAEFRDWFAKLAAFDVVANNADRKSGHVLFDETRLLGDRQRAVLSRRGQAAHRHLGVRGPGRRRAPPRAHRPLRPR